MRFLLLLTLSGVLGLGPAAAQPAAFGPLQFQPLLQRFVSQNYLKSFRYLGEEKDFDHGHLLFDAKDPAKPVAILYHTQELIRDKGLDHAKRNWLQWVDTGRVEDAAVYERKAYPASAVWDWFKFKELPTLRSRDTILDKMLDPALLKSEIAQSRQWSFTRAACGPATLKIALPSGGSVCLALRQTL